MALLPASSSRRAFRTRPWRVAASSGVVPFCSEGTEADVRRGGRAVAEVVSWRTDRALLLARVHCSHANYTVTVTAVGSVQQGIPTGNTKQTHLVRRIYRRAELKKDGHSGGVRAVPGRGAQRSAAALREITRGAITRGKHRHPGVQRNDLKRSGSRGVSEGRMFLGAKIAGSHTLSVASTDAPRRSSSRTQAVRPHFAAVISGVTPSCSIEQELY